MYACDAPLVFSFLRLPFARIKWWLWTGAPLPSAFIKSQGCLSVMRYFSLLSSSFHSFIHSSSNYPPSLILV